MKMIKKLYEYFTKRRQIVRECIEEPSNIYMERVQKSMPRFYATFYEQIIACTIVDAYEYFAEIQTDHNFFYHHIEELTIEKGEKFLKWVAVYHTIYFLRPNRKEIDPRLLEITMFYTYDFSDREKHIYYELKTIREMDDMIYPIEFSKVLLKEVFDVENSHGVQIGFVYNYLYNSYDNFIRSFTKYVSIKSRLA